MVCNSQETKYTCFSFSDLMDACIDCARDIYLLTTTGSVSYDDIPAYSQCASFV